MRPTPVYPPNSEGKLTHFGVKGMHWGQRKAPTAESQKTRSKSTVSKSSKVTKAISTAYTYHAYAVGALALTHVLYRVGSTAVHAGATGIIIKAAKNREAAYETGRLAVKALAPVAAKVNYAKMVRGAYKITTL